MNLNDYHWLVEILWTIIPVIVAIAIQKVYPVLRSKYLAQTTETQRYIINEVVRAVVIGVEGYMKSSPGHTKYAEAERMINEILSQKNIPVTVAEVKAAIEAAVYEELNRNKPPVPPVDPAKTQDLSGYTFVR